VSQRHRRDNPTTMAAASRSATDSNGTTISYLDFGGVGQLIVLLHGLAGQGSEWTETAISLTGRGNVVAPDLRGHEYSDRHFVEPVFILSRTIEHNQLLPRQRSLRCVMYGTIRRAGLAGTLGIRQICCLLLNFDVDSCTMACQAEIGNCHANAGRPDVNPHIGAMRPPPRTEIDTRCRR